MDHDLASYVPPLCVAPGVTVWPLPAVAAARPVVARLDELEAWARRWRGAIVEGIERVEYDNRKEPTPLDACPDLSNEDAKRAWRSEQAAGAQQALLAMVKDVDGTLGVIEAAVEARSRKMVARMTALAMLALYAAPGAVGGLGEEDETLTPEARGALQMTRDATAAGTLVEEFEAAFPEFFGALSVAETAGAIARASTRDATRIRTRTRRPAPKPRKKWAVLSDWLKRVGGKVAGKSLQKEWSTWRRRKPPTVPWSSRSGSPAEGPTRS